MTRPTWDQWFVELAQTVARRGTCDRARVGAVIVEMGKFPVSVGYNGAQAGEKHCDEIGHLMQDGHCLRARHAERNAIDIAYQLKIPIAGNTIYCTHAPCLICAMNIVAANLVRVVYQYDYSDPSGLEYLQRSGIKVERIES